MTANQIKEANKAVDALQKLFKLLPVRPITANGRIQDSKDLIKEMTSLLKKNNG